MAYDLKALSCEYCGGNLVQLADNTLKCECCESIFIKEAAIPEELILQLNRANSSRRLARFDQSLDEYKLVLQDYPDNYEANWGAFLCEYGIEYVMDKDGSYKPTCNRAQYRPVTENKYFKKCFENCSENERVLLIKRGNEIETIRKQIIAIADKQQPYDIFICYKQTTMDGKNRAPEADWGKDLYYRLNGIGFKVFFAEITLPSKSGAYEANIFSALNSCQLMLILSSSPDHLESEWVRNEWSRFLRIKQDKPDRKFKVVIDGFDAYELPIELQKEQAIDRKELGWFDDLRKYISTVFRTNNMLDAEQEEKQKQYSATLEEQLMSLASLSNIKKLGNNDTVEELINSTLIQDALKEYEDGASYKQLLKSLEEVSNTSDAQRLLFLASCQEKYSIPVKSEEDLLGIADDISNNPHFTELLRLCDDKTKEIYTRIARICEHNVAIESNLNKSIKLLDKGYYEQTSKICEKMLEINPNYAKSWEVLLHANTFSKYGELYRVEDFDKRDEYQNMLRCLGSRPNPLLPEILLRDKSLDERHNQEYELSIQELNKYCIEKIDQAATLASHYKEKLRTNYIEYINTFAEIKTMIKNLFSSIKDYDYFYKKYKKHSKYVQYDIDAYIACLEQENKVRAMYWLKQAVCVPFYFAYGIGLIPAVILYTNKRKGKYYKHSSDIIKVYKKQAIAVKNKMFNIAKYYEASVAQIDNKLNVIMQEYKESMRRSEEMAKRDLTYYYQAQKCLPERFEEDARCKILIDTFKEKYPKAEPIYPSFSKIFDAKRIMDESMESKEHASVFGRITMKDELAALPQNNDWKNLFKDKSYKL